MQFGLVDELQHPMFSRDALKSFGGAQRRQGVASPDFEIRFPEERHGDRPDVAGLGRSSCCCVYQFPCAFDLTQLPHGRGEERQSGSASVTEKLLKLRIGVRAVRVEGPLAIGPRLDKISTPVSDQAKLAIGNAGFHDPSGILRFAPERQGQLSCRAQFACCARCRILTEQRGETLWKAVRRFSQLSNARERRLGLSGGEAFCHHHRLAVPGMKSEPLLMLRFSGLDFLGHCERRQQRLRFGDLGHFGRRRKAFERRRKDGVGVGGAAGRLVELGERKRSAQFEAARASAASRPRWRSGRLLPQARGWRGRA